ncbi:DUF4367 domain-containing protein [Paenibacillus sp. MMS20-IR301]|uniref:DUF4367 domain-containing protein n=1 Tax=Paenibacillus sp. MMS20-IR301 TaxID=2895946 RepID=UPI0028E82BC9|nr:DUF4367 domain-containing protein [Paenibacillus sp. MMS20-IR301]WNS41115.1 DUF4367 domain-containing protein [Paenibacillus sp. MMS20-IR301]
MNNKKKAEEALELQKLGVYLAQQDFSRDSDQAAVLRKVRSRSISKQEELKVTIKGRFRRPAMIAASLLVAGAVSVTIVSPSFAQEMLVRVLKTVNLGNIIAHEMDVSLPPEFPEVWKGQIFDKAGNPVESLSPQRGAIYNAAGEEIVDFDGDKLITQSEKEELDKAQAARIFAVKEPAELDKYALFKVKLPEYLPEGFTFDRGEFYKGEDGVNGQVVELFFNSPKKGKRIWMQLRLSNRDNAYEMSTDGTIEQVNIKGVDAILMNNRGLDWEANGVLYYLGTRGLNRAEVLKIAESINW